MRWCVVVMCHLCICSSLGHEVETTRWDLAGVRQAAQALSEMGNKMMHSQAPGTASANTRPEAPGSQEKGNMGPLMPYALNLMFGNTNAARSRGYAYGMYGYMPFGDGYGGGMLNDGSVLGEGGGKPWWYDYDGTGPQYSTAALGNWDFLPIRGPPCPPDCGQPDYESPQPM